MSVQKVLILRTDKIGDLILSTPAIRNVREGLPSAQISLVATPYNAPVVDNSPHLDEVIEFDPEWSLVRKARFAYEMRSRQFDMAIVLSPRTPAYVLGWLSGAPIRAGIVYRRRLVVRALSPLLLTHSYIPDRGLTSDRMPHEVTQTLALLREAGLPGVDYPLQVYPTESDRIWAGNQLDDLEPGNSLIGIHLSGKWHAEGWKADNLLRLMQAILADVPGSRVIATHGIADEATAEPLKKLLAKSSLGGNIKLVGEMQFGQWASLFALCDIVISPDTGSLHLAAAVQRPVVALFSASTFEHCSRQWAPWCVPQKSLVLTADESTAASILDAICVLLNQDGCIAAVKLNKSAG